MIRMTPRFRLAILTAILALLLSAAVVPFVRHWHQISSNVRIDDPEHPGRVKQITIFFHIYWFYVAATVGSFLASFITLRPGETVRARSVILFLVRCDFFYAWIGGMAYILHLNLLPRDVVMSTLQHTAGAGGISKWVELPVLGLIGGLLFGNIVTGGFGFLIGLPSIICLALRRRWPRLIGWLFQ
jgi:hypothetical protein